MYVVQQGGATLVPAGMLQNGQQVYTLADGGSMGAAGKHLASIALAGGNGAQYLATPGNGLPQTLGNPQGLQGLPGQQPRYVQLNQPGEMQLVRVPAQNQGQVIQGVVQPGRQFAQVSAGRTLIPVQLQPNGTLQAVRPAGVVPQTTTVLRPAANGTLYAQANAMPGAIRPLVARIPRLGTVQTYNPSTGTLVQPPSSNGATVATIQQPVAIRAQTPLGMAAGNVAQPVAVRVGGPRPDVGGRILQATSGSAGLQQHLLMQQQQLVQVGGRTVAVQQASQGRPVLLNSNGTQMVGNLVRLAQGNGGNGGVSLVDQSLVARLMEAQAQQPRNTVLKVPVAAAQSIMQQQQTNINHIDMSMLGVSNQQQLNGAKLQFTQERQQVMRPLSTPSATLQDGYLMDNGLVGRSSELNQISLSADLFPNTMSSTDSISGMPLARGISAPITNSSLMGSMDDIMQQNQRALASGDMANVRAGSEDIQTILSSIGVELARHGIPVDIAANAGWLGVLGPRDVALLQEAYAEEEARLAGEGTLNSTLSIGAASNGGAGPGNDEGHSNGSPATSVMSSQARAMVGGLTPEQLLQLQGTAAMGPAGGLGFPYSLLGSDAGAGSEQDPGTMASLDAAMWGKTAPASQGEVNNGSKGSGGSADGTSGAPQDGANNGTSNQDGAVPGNGLADRFANLNLGCGFF
uniref:Uncharacterized protein n=1 Tax=Chlamydomonas leiostraca TaxID=1034604 RepID=A0A7S0RJI8_9CHLO|mmetsp:Transcript_23786/g.60668  ORF Transcript_23786/g.60668 Transcript_23786/m.60668 type:complete len:689 (+) Transcript_23786:174-2240(+)|eukprot:CAMPEP_0202862396 /NCGR_PEP_ID=MMETSP1391-20130828/3450_1 /ASSEMBLY_ACC=CAM_ASM_000867 /TAXON_ID=1034604 /ORGANISM="Chlamydomonas leiostraca, Strain SAG 11-49" /LENGTH=688 /DNA_ID=CAMNT_0049541931 /DNA_START=124 /DNA_END=2190 /DNA_ORIENTATION=+